MYLTCGGTRAFDGPAAEHMLALVKGGIEYLEMIATAYDKASRDRMVKVIDEARRELERRLREEGR